MKIDNLQKTVLVHTLPVNLSKHGNFQARPTFWLNYIWLQVELIMNPGKGLTKERPSPIYKQDCSKCESFENHHPWNGLMFQNELNNILRNQICILKYDQNILKTQQFMKPHRKCNCTVQHCTENLWLFLNDSNSKIFLDFFLHMYTIGMCSMCAHKLFLCAQIKRT